MNLRPMALAAVAVLAATGGYFAARFLQPADGAIQPGPNVTESAQVLQPQDLVGQQRPDFSHHDANGKTVSAREFDGHPLLLNFWATWCTPCVDEMPMLSALQEEYRSSGLRVVGIALDDAERAAAFAADMELSYPVLFGSTDVVLTGRRYGNRGGMLPFTVLVDAGGIIRWSHLGALEHGQLQAILTGLD